MQSGGPVEDERGFVLHSRDYESSLSTLEVTERVAMTATMDIMEDIASGQGPGRLLIALGYCGWGPGQLEEELGLNAWLTCDCDDGLIFDTPDSGKWEGALNLLGINPLSLSTVSGRA